MLRELLERASERIPSQCAVCGAWPARPVCEACVARFAQPLQRCDRCALALSAPVRRCGACLRKPPALDACLAAVPYAYPWSGLILAWKFGGQSAWSAWFAQLVRSAPWVEPALEQSDLVLSMPLSRQRLRQRGFNQALELARKIDPSRADARLLLRIKDTPAQSTLKRSERLRSVQSAFAVAPLRQAELRGARVLLVDDVMTTGASLNSAAAALHAAGAIHVTGLVLARTDEPPDPA